MGAHSAAASQAAKARAQADRGFARNPQRDPLHGPQRRRLADAADQFRPMADGLLYFGRPYCDPLPTKRIRLSATSIQPTQLVGLQNNAAWLPRNGWWLRVLSDWGWSGQAVP